MNRKAMSLNWNSLLSGTLGIAAALFAVAYLGGMKLPWIVSDRAALYALPAAGFGMCMLSMGRTATGLGWTHPITIAGVILGALIITVVVAAAAGWRLPLITSDRAALLFVAAGGLLKWGLGIFSRVVLKV